MRNGPHDKIKVKKQLCSSPKEETWDFIWSYVKQSIILLAVAYFEKQSGQIQLSHQKNWSHIISHPATGLQMVNENASVSDAWESNTFKLVVNLHCCCWIKMLLVMLSSLSQVRTTRQKVSSNNKTCHKPIPLKFYLPDKLPYVIPKCCDWSDNNDQPTILDNST